MNEELINLLKAESSSFRRLQSSPVEDCSTLDVAASLLIIQDLGLRGAVSDCLAKDAVDVYLSLSCLNLLNHFIKISREKELRYEAFKPCLNVLLASIKEKGIDGVDYQVDIEDGMPSCAVEVGDVQFCFHGINDDETFRSLLKENKKVVFDHVSKQPIASSVFASGLEVYKHFGKVMIDGKPLLEAVDKQLDDFRSKKLVIWHDGLIKVYPSK
jgi:hypothetical protein